MDPIVFDREFAAPVEDLWAAWTEPRGLTRWLCQRAEVEMAVDGAFELFWDEPGGAPSPPLGCRVRAYEEEYSFTADWKGTGEHATLLNGPPFRTQIVVRFQPLGPGRCRLHFVHQGWGDDGAWSGARDWHQTFWEDAFRKLKAVLETSGG
jgi:uncharacterized protein YndB with AHSA1/START domain